MAIILSLAVYIALSLTIARVFVRTGHSLLWVAIAFVPTALILIAYAMSWFGVFPKLTSGILMIVVLVYLAILAILSMKSWPAQQSGRMETHK